MAKRGNSHGAAKYRVEVNGRLSGQWADWFGGIQIESVGEITILTGNLDQSALQGLMVRLCDLGLPLLSVNRIES